MPLSKYWFVIFTVAYLWGHASAAVTVDEEARQATRQEGKETSEESGQEGRAQGRRADPGKRHGRHDPLRYRLIGVF